MIPIEELVIVMKQTKYIQTKITTLTPENMKTIKYKKIYSCAWRKSAWIDCIDSKGWVNVYVCIYIENAHTHTCKHLTSLVPSTD